MSNQVEPFADNWTYLKAELNWLDRLLMLAVARQRKDSKAIDHLAQSRADRVSSHWWKGLVTLEGETAYDDYIPSRAAQRDKAAKAGYQQQIDGRIRASLEQGHCLGLPWLRDRLKLSTFEKNLVLISLAPEVSRRYTRLYSYLQGNESPQASERPTVDLVFRLLCRNDGEWRTARTLLTSTSPLVQTGLLEVLADREEPLLTRSLKLLDPLVNYLLAEKPDPRSLETLLHLPAQETSFYIQSPTPDQPGRTDLDQSAEQATSFYIQFPTCDRLNQQVAEDSEGDIWSTLVLPEDTLATLKHLCHKIQCHEQVNQTWGFQSASDQQGATALLVGLAGTGKTSAAQAIAYTLQTPLTWIDLAHLAAEEHISTLQQICQQSPIVLLLKSAHIWFGRHSPLSPAQLHQFLRHRQESISLTLLSVHLLQTVRPQWQQQLHSIVSFPMPDESARLRLWQQVFPAQVPLDPDLDLAWLAHRPLSGGSIAAIAREAAFYAAGAAAPTLSMKHLLQALQFLSYPTKHRLPKQP